jgi:hypothetical protein
MNWEALGALGEIVGAVAVILTLGYLAVQIRQNTRAVRRSSHQSAVDAFVNVNLTLLQDSEITRIVNTGLQRPEELDANELTRFERWAGANQAHYQNLFYQYQDGIIEDELWKSYETTLREFVGTPGFTKYWERCRHRFSSSYQEFVERLRSS